MQKRIGSLSSEIRIRTDMLPVTRPGVEAGTLSLDTILSRIPAGRLADASEIGDAVSFLVSDQARYMNGQTLYVDGGFMVDYGVPLAKKPE